MTEGTRKRQILGGGEFLLNEAGSVPAFIPETFTSEQRMMYETTNDFMENDVLPVKERIEQKDYDLLKEKLRKAAEIGLCSVEIPEEYGGLGCDITTSMLVSEALSSLGSFSVTYGGHAAIGSNPIIYFGTEEQKKRYLPRLATAELISAYALTEPRAGSDAMSIRTRAELSEDGKAYILNGTKMWITNARFADLFITFAKVDGDQFTAFIVERAWEGVKPDRDEEKMGLHGSSTALVQFENVRVPKENVLGTIGKGYKIAFNTLNLGRLKLAIGTTGGGKRALRIAAEYASERKQFGRPIATFDIIRRKLAEMAVQTFAAESATYRLAGLLDQRIEQLDAQSPEHIQNVIKILQEYNIEASICKVFASEALSFTVDEALQIHGGNGYSEEYEVCRMYRDARINRIFEGTNEINRLLVPGTLLKRAMRGQLDIMTFAMQVAASLQNPDTLPRQDQDTPLGPEIQATEYTKRMLIHILAQAAQKYMQALKEEQQVLAELADVGIAAYVMDSLVSRTSQLLAEGHEKAELAHICTKIFCNEAYRTALKASRTVIDGAFEGAEADALHQAMDALVFPYRINVFDLKRQVSDAVLDEKDYPFDIV